MNDKTKIVITDIAGNLGTILGLGFLARNVSLNLYIYLTRRAHSLSISSKTADLFQ